MLPRLLILITSTANATCCFSSQYGIPAPWLHPKEPWLMLNPGGESRSLQIASRGSDWWEDSLRGKLHRKDWKGQRGDASHGLVTSGGRGLEREHGHEQERGSVRKKRLERTLRKKGRSRAGTTWTMCSMEGWKGKSRGRDSRGECRGRNEASNPESP